jgi:hypothetical protein
MGYLSRTCLEWNPHFPTCAEGIFFPLVAPVVRGNFGEFIPRNGDWSVYLERVEIIRSYYS